MRSTEDDSSAANSLFKVVAERINAYYYRKALERQHSGECIRKDDEELRGRWKVVERDTSYE